MVLARWQATVVDDEGNVQPAASVEVRREGVGSPLVSLYSDRNGVTPLGNPFAADTEGLAAFHVSGGAYKITATKGAFSRIWRYVGVGTASEFDGTESLSLVQNVDAGYGLIFETGTTAPPGAGGIRFNNANLASATSCFIDAENSGGSAIAARLLELFSVGRAIKDTIIISDSESNKQASFTVAGATDNTTYVTLTISGHAGATSFDANILVTLQRERAGADGLQPGLRFNFDSSTSMADPGAGDFRLNNSSFASVTAIAVDDTSAESGNPDVSADVLSWDDSDSTVRGTLIIQKASAPQNFAVYSITGASTDNSGWTQLAVTYVTGSGSFTNADSCVLKFARAGNRGTNGINPGLTFNFDSSTSMADPGNGDFRLNNATLSSVTAAAFDDLSSASGNPDVSAAVLCWDDSTNTSDRGHLLIKKISAPQNFALYRITGASTDNSGWTQLALTYVAHAGSFADTDPCSVEFSPSGNQPATASETVEGAVEMATTAEIRSAATGAKAIMAEDLETAAAAVALTDASTVAVDWDTGINFTLTVTANRIIGNPTNGQPGTWRTILVQGNDATDRTITFGNQYLGDVPTITDADSGRYYLLTIMCISSSHFVVYSKRAMG